MLAERIELTSVQQATEVLDQIGSNNSALMATRGIFINVFVHQTPGELARALKRVYNDIGAEVAISYEAYSEKQGAITDLIAMGTLYQHREAMRILENNTDLLPVLQVIDNVIKSAPEAT